MLSPWKASSRQGWKRLVPKVDGSTTRGAFVRLGSNRDERTDNDGEENSTSSEYY